jgi:hypothetical protein
MNEKLKNSTETRMDAQRTLVKRMASIATRLVPDGHGAHLRFINKKTPNLNDLDESQINENMKFKPAGATPIGTQIKEKILKPFVYDVLDAGNTLQRPYLILTITDGSPYNEDNDTFKNAIVECGRRLTESPRGYEQEGKH